eukprot:TRINITY_DN7006_c0_g1_i1.p1 TRINITY_DN7006_c0_g1~~TRINITY_DN7006_c0_g1_i1.p1  ORF type:complete len:365 (-),score=97.01 TRINITY_DN7006_c0_g1_i1:192-1286(-)
MESRHLLNDATNWGAQADGYPEGVTLLDVFRSTQITNYCYFTSQKVQAEIPNLCYLGGFILAISLIRYFVKSVVIERLVRILGITNQRAIDGLKENAWYTGYYVVAAFPFGLWVYNNEPWSIFRSQTMWDDWPLQQFPYWYRMYYLMELGFYGSHLIALHMDSVKKDYFEMVIHHFATFGLVLMSYWGREHRVGLIILLLHNLSDIFLYFGKTIDFYGKGTSRASVEVYKQTMLVLFAVSFLCSRLIFFPVYVIYSTLFESVAIGVPPFYVETNVLLIVLVLLHVFWFYLIVVVATKSLRRGSIEDIREPGHVSDSDDDDDDAPSASGAAGPPADSAAAATPSTSSGASRRDRGDKSQKATKRR